MNGRADSPLEKSTGRQLEVNKRKTWFYETQLRRLNLDRFRQVRPDQPGPLLDLISEPAGVPAIRDLGRVYRDSQQPVWTDDDAARHGAFADSLIGRMGDFLNAREPRKLAERLKNLRDEYEASAFGSVTDPLGLGQFPRTVPEPNPDGAPRPDPARPADSKAVAHQPGRARGREALADSGALQRAGRRTRATPRGWVTSLERYVADFETELVLTVGGIAGTPIPFDLDAPATYRGFLAGMLTATSDPLGERGRGGADRRTQEEEARGQGSKYIYRFSIATNGSPMGPVAELPAVRAGEVLVRRHPPLAQGVRGAQAELRHGPVPAGAPALSVRHAAAKAMRRRRRPQLAPASWRQTRPSAVSSPTRATAIGDDAELRRRLQVAETKLRIILEETAAHPRSFDPSFSPLAGEILKQGLLSYKYWLDEQPRALDNDRLNKVKNDLGYGDDEVDHEMEFWSENHYIMFASSEYLLGQLWQDDEFPARAGSSSTRATRPARRTGAQRRDRGRARVLKWLNNRLMFGWMEFNSSGYYREHLWALLNLVDFALDEEVRTKATMAVDLMLFDVIAVPAPRRDGRRRRAQPVQVQEPRVRQRADRRRRDDARRQGCASVTATRRLPRASPRRPTRCRRCCSRSARPRRRTRSRTARECRSPSTSRPSTASRGRRIR